MGFLLRDALRRLCVEIGWSYAVFWRAIGSRNPKKLVWEDGHCERLPSISGFDAMDMLLKEKGLARGSANDWSAEVGSQAEDKLGMLFKKMMVSQVHVVGEGVVGRAVLTGHHQWILRDMLGVSSSDISAEIKAQFLAGIQTIAIIPLLPFGVVQLGSTEMVIENIGFINHVRCLLAQLGSVSRTVTSDVTQKAFSKNSIVQESPAVLGFTCPSGEFGAQAVRSLPAISARVSHQPDQSSISLRTAKQPCDSASLHFNAKSDSGVSKVSPANMATAATQVTHSKMLLQVSDPIVKPGHLNSPLECHSPKTQVSLIDPGIRFNQQASEYSSRSGFENNSLAVTSELYSSSLAILGKLPTPSSNNGLLEKKSTSSNSESVQIRSSRSKSSYQQTGSDVGSFYGRKGQFSGHACGETSSFPVDTKVNVKTSQDIPSGNGGNFMTNDKINNLDGKRVISEDSMYTHLMEKDFQKIVAAGKKDQGNDLFQSIGVLPAESGKDGASFDSLGTLLQSDCWTSTSNPSEEKQRFWNGESIVNSHELFLKEPCFMDLLDGQSAKLIQSGSGNDLFDVLGIEYKSSHCDAHELDADVSTLIIPSDRGPLFDSLNHENSCIDIFTENYHDQLLDAVVSKAKPGAKQNSDDDVSCRTSITNTSSSSFHGSSSASGRFPSSGQTGTNTSCFLRMLSKSEPTIYNAGKSACSSDKTEECTMSEPYRTPIIPWVDNGQNIKSGRASSAQCKRVDDIGKLTRKRARTGESPRPRPKDRQMIQDRVKELREIVPNGAKCSIDALLEKTIKHMLFLQSVTKHADKLKETGEPKIISKEGGLLLKDSFESGATWAFEVGNQPMICPIIVEDLNAPRQMLVEMLCEERGFFLEIADLIRGMGLTILKGVMEARDDKIWARFVAEANRDVTRMEIFLSLVHLLELTMGSHIAPVGVDNLAMPQMPAPPSSMPATVISDGLV